MEEIIKQSFTFAEISVYKNYCNINDKPISVNEVSIDDEGCFSNLVDMTSRSLNSASNNFDLLLYQKNQYQFFYSNNCNNYFVNYTKRDKPQVFYDIIKLTKAVSLGKSENKHLAFETTESKHIKKYYNDPFAEITIHKIERWIKKDGDKIIVKLFINKRIRGVNKRYFTKKTESKTITFNLKTGNFNIVEFENIKKEQTKRFYSNSFVCLKQSLNGIYGFHSKFRIYSKFSEILIIFNDQVFQDVMKKTFKFDENFIEQGIDFHIKVKDFTSETEVRPSIEIDFIGLWINKFIELKKIKAPNEAIRLIGYYYPTEKFLKKNDRKLIASILDRFGIKSKLTIKIMHEQQHTHISKLVKTCCLFGENYSKYIGNIPLDFFCCMTDPEQSIYEKNELLKFRYLNKNTVKFSDREKESIVKILNDYYLNYGKHIKYFSKNNLNMGSIIDTIYDHYEMIERIKEYYPDVKLDATTYKTFRDEHTQLSVIDNRIKAGISIEYVFDNKMIEEIEKPIEILITDWNHDKSSIEVNPIVKRELYIPKILKSSEDYIEEGEYMHHCVSGYVDKERSIIISLRHQEERVTCEYSVASRRALQMRYFANDPPPTHYVKPLEILEQRISNFSGRFMSINKIKKNLQINGKEVPIPTENFF